MRTAHKCQYSRKWGPRIAGRSVALPAALLQRRVSTTGQRSRRRGCGSGCTPGRLQTSGSIQRSGSNVDMVYDYCYELCADAIAETSTKAHISLDEPSGEDQEYCLSDRLADSGLNPEDQCRNAELRRRLLQSVAQLSPSLRRVFELRDLDGRSVREAAHTLGLAEGTVKAQLSRARAKLTRLMRHALRPERHSVLVRTSSSVDRGTQLEQVPATICRTLHHMMMRTATVTPATDRQDWSEAAVKRETRSRTAI